MKLPRSAANPNIEAGPSGSKPGLDADRPTSAPDSNAADAPVGGDQPASSAPTGSDRPPSGSSPPPSEAVAPPGEALHHRALGLRDGLEGLRDLMDRLLAEDGCPWDREQTLDSLRPYLLEEAHEVLEALDEPTHHCEELGDLLFQIVFHAALRQRQGAFDLDDVIASIRTKMIRRHPHVFASGGAADMSASDVEEQWEQIKSRERAGVKAPVFAVARGLPPLLRSWRMQNKAAAAGFDWPTIDGALAKFAEEWREFEEARRRGTREEMLDELGDLLFVLVRIGQKLDLSADEALSRANRKFEARMTFVLRRCQELGIDPTEAGLERLDELWQQAKRSMAPDRP